MAIDYGKFTTPELLEALEWAGRYPHPDLIRACLARRDKITPGLLKMLAADVPDESPPPDPRWYRNVHAGLFLIALREPDALAIMAEIYRDPEREELTDWFDCELPGYGPMIIPWATELLDDATIDEEVYRSYAAELLGGIACSYPDERDRIVEILRARLPKLRDDGTLVLTGKEGKQPNLTWSAIILTLADLKDTSSRRIGIALYSADLVDEQLIGDAKYYLDAFDSDQRPALGRNRPYDIFQAYERLHDADALVAELTELKSTMGEEAFRQEMKARFGKAERGSARKHMH